MASLPVDIVVSVVKIIAAMALSAGALYSGISLFDRLTPGLDEWKEIKKGNSAVAVLLSSLMLSIIILASARIGDLVFYIQADLPLLLSVKLLALMFINYLLGLLAAVTIAFITVNLIDRITPDLEELAELKKGNIAVAIILSVSLILVALGASGPLEILFNLIKSLESVIL